MKNPENVSKSMESVTKQKISKPNMMTENEGKESDADYDNDDFEKDDLVKIAEPNAQKAMVNKRKQKLADRQTKESS